MYPLFDINSSRYSGNALHLNSLQCNYTECSTEKQIHFSMKFVQFNDVHYYMCRWITRLIENLNFNFDFSVFSVNRHNSSPRKCLMSFSVMPHHSIDCVNICFSHLYKILRNRMANSKWNQSTQHSTRPTYISIAFPFQWKPFELKKKKKTATTSEEIERMEIVCLIRHIVIWISHGNAYVSLVRLYCIYSIIDYY